MINNFFTWKYILHNELKKTYFIKIINFINKEIKKGKYIYPNINDIFNIFKLININQIKVVIIGQDPYYLKGLAHGIAFSVLPNILRLPNSLKNIYKELEYEYNIKIINNNYGYLMNWVKQGVFLFNTILTVEKNKPKSHINIGWQKFTFYVIKIISYFCNNIVFLLWGEEAKKIINIIYNNNHYILCTSHPSPLSMYKGFYTCNHFIKTNIWLNRKKKISINWLKHLKYKINLTYLL